MKKVFVVMLVAIAAVSCNKNQKAVKTLDGTWEVTEIKTTDDEGNVTVFELDGFEQTVIFDNCKLKKDEFCTLTSTSSFGGVSDTEVDVYRVTDDGTTLEIKDDEGSSTTNVSTIDELTDDSLVISETDEDETTQVTYKKK